MVVVGRPKLDVDVELVAALKDKGLGWRSLIKEYQKLTGEHLSRDTAKRRFLDYQQGNGKGENKKGFAPILSRSERLQNMALKMVNTTYISRKDYDTSLLLRLHQAGLSWRAVAQVYTFRTGRRICHKTAKRKVEAILCR